MIRRIVIVTIAAAVVVSASAAAAVAWDDIQAEDDSPSTSAPLAGRILSAGRVVKVDPCSGVITIEHGPIGHLYMETMTMVFRVRDPVMLTALMPGAKVRFEVQRDSDGYIITKIENSN